MERLAPFIARSVAGRLVTIKVYGPSSNTDLSSRQIIAQRQFLTNEYGHFTGRLIVSPPQSQTPPETWTVTASLSPTKGGSIPMSVREEVKFIPEHGISIISDIDDTVKHTSILSGARELCRNTFVRDLGSMSIEGVREWYSSLVQLGVQIHYVSNSPYQCWPIINSFMTAVGLPRGDSVHLKQYSGMISGIWENAADKKRAGVETIIRVPTHLFRTSLTL
jgi:phosphatidate phosphatase APP1